MPILRAEDLFSRLCNGEHLLSDGAMGTELGRRGVGARDILRANVRQPSLVAEIHDSYAESGTHILTANTFGLSDGPDWQENTRAGLRLVIEAAQRHDKAAWISLISRIVCQEPEFAGELAREAQAQGLAVLIETCVRLDEAVEAAQIVRHIGYESVLAVTCHFQAEGTMPDGSASEEVARALASAGADIVGGNCGEGPQMFLPIAERMRAATDAPLLFQPNASLPHPDARGNQVYSIGPIEFAEAGKKLFQAGANIVGGCCGTTPEHISQLAVATTLFAQSP